MLTRSWGDQNAHYIPLDYTAFQGIVSQRFRVSRRAKTQWITSELTLQSPTRAKVEAATKLEAIV